MKSPIWLLVGLNVALFAGGCATARRSAPTETSAAVASVSVVRVRIESVPHGALVVFGGNVVGHAPQWISVPVNRTGFFRERTSVRVRFLAEGSADDSRSVTAEFDVLDKVPASIVFTREGWTRVSR